MDNLDFLREIIQKLNNHLNDSKIKQMEEMERNIKIHAKIAIEGYKGDDKEILEIKNELEKIKKIGVGFDCCQNCLFLYLLNLKKELEENINK